MKKGKQQAVFLDRDGNINVEKGYIRNIEELELIPGSGEAVRLLNQAGILAILVTNQTGAARGFYPESHIQALNKKTEDLLNQHDARLDAVYYCPHFKDSAIKQYALACNCRKPAPGLIHQALERFPNVDLSASFVIGDKASDISMAHNTGCRGLLVRTGYGEQVLAGEYQKLEHPPEAVFENLLEAVQYILKDE